MDTPALANDKYRATLRSTFIDGVDTSLDVTAIPTNLPTIVTVGWDTDFETVFRVEGASGTNSSNYSLTGVTKIKGYSGNLPENLAVNCLNNEEFFNQWGEQIAAVQEIAEAAQEATEDLPEVVVGTTDVQTITNKRITKRIGTITSSATPTPAGDDIDVFTVTALATGATFAAPTGTPTEGQALIIRIKDNGTARALSFNAIYRFSADLPAPTTTILSKTMYLGFIYNAADSKWDCVAKLDNL